jgi:isocitrate/isopropylmalate dehydrogenase
MFGVLEQLDLRKMLSSYQRLKFKKDLAQKVAEELKEDIEFIIMRPNTARAKNIRREVKERQNG